MKRIAFALSVTMVLVFVAIQSCKHENNINPAFPENSGEALSREELLMLPSGELMNRIKDDAKRDIPTLRDAGPVIGPMPVLNCAEGADCITGVELLQVVPQTPNFRFRIDMARTYLNVTTSQQFYNLPANAVCEFVVLAYPAAYANQLIQAGVQNVISIASPGVAYQFPYHENESVFMFGLFDTDGSGDPGCDPHVDLRLYHRYGWDCFELHDVWCNAPQSILTNTLRWATTKCNNENPPHTGNISCPH
ncbi:MAG: hypothetical protein KA165_11420 [Saprospiraceae bacterium]|nr:hypothetical protein [Saprospiraceae bacterium]